MDPADPIGRPPRSGPGCLIIALLLPVVMVVGIVIGSVLNQQEDPNGEKSLTLAEGTLEATDWRVTAERDIEGETCTFLYAAGEQVAGACTLTPQDATFGDQTVVFGRSAGTTDAVSLQLTNGKVVSIDTQRAAGFDGRFYVQVVPGDVDAEGFAP